LAKGLADRAWGIVQQRHGGFAHDHRLAAFGKPYRQFVFSVADLNRIEHPNRLLFLLV
jgi:hypothetical protein